MKKLITLVLVVIATTFAGCSSDDGGGSTQGDLFLKFTYNGQQYNYEPETITTQQKLIMGLEVDDLGTTRLSLWMPETPSIGNYQINDNPPNDENIDILANAFFYMGDNSYAAKTGSLVITSVTQDYIQGNFSFTAEDLDGNSISITGGSFKAYN